MNIFLNIITQMIQFKWKTTNTYIVAGLAILDLKNKQYSLRKQQQQQPN